MLKLSLPAKPPPPPTNVSVIVAVWPGASVPMSVEMARPWTGTVPWLEVAFDTGAPTSPRNCTPAAGFTRSLFFTSTVTV